MPGSFFLKPAQGAPVHIHARVHGTKGCDAEFSGTETAFLNSFFERVPGCQFERSSGAWEPL